MADKKDKTAYNQAFFKNMKDEIIKEVVTEVVGQLGQRIDNIKVSASNETVQLQVLLEDFKRSLLQELSGSVSAAAPKPSARKSSAKAAAAATADEGKLYTKPNLHFRNILFTSIDQIEDLYKTELILSDKESKDVETLFEKAREMLESSADEINKSKDKVKKQAEISYKILNKHKKLSELFKNEMKKYNDTKQTEAPKDFDENDSEYENYVA